MLNIKLINVDHSSSLHHCRKWNIGGTKNTYLMKTKHEIMVLRSEQLTMRGKEKCEVTT